MFKSCLYNWICLQDLLSSLLGVVLVVRYQFWVHYSAQHLVSESISDRAGMVDSTKTGVFHRKPRDKRFIHQVTPKTPNYWLPMDISDIDCKIMEEWNYQFFNDLSIDISGEKILCQLFWAWCKIQTPWSRIDQCLCNSEPFPVGPIPTQKVMV